LEMGKNLNFTAACVATALVATTVTPSAADEQFAPTTVVQLPDGQILAAFDISFVSGRTLAIAASRVVGNGGPIGTVIVADTESNVVTQEIGAGTFVGDCSVPPARDEISGPNGVIVIEKGAMPMSGRATARFSIRAVLRRAASRRPVPSRFLTCTPTLSKRRSRPATASRAR
jgi:hypothetical protein